MVERQIKADAVKRDALGPERLAMWKGLVRKYGPSDAIRKFVAKDGSELTLDQLRNRGYGSLCKLSTSSRRKGA